MTQLIGAIRRVRREVAGAVQVIAEHCNAHDYDDPGEPGIAWDDKQARDRLVDAWSATRTGCWGICPISSWVAGGGGGGVAGLGGRLGRGTGRGL